MDVGFYTYASAVSIIAGSLICIFTLQSSVEVKGNVGLQSLGSYYGVAIVSSAIIYPVLVRLIGRKYNLLLGDASAILFGISLIYPIPAVAIATTALLGCLESSFWSAAYAIGASYKDSTLHAAADGVVSGKVLRLIVIIGLGQAVLSLIPEILLRESITKPDRQRVGVTNVTLDMKCGAQDCPNEYFNESHHSTFHNLIPSSTSLYVFVGILAGIQTAALIVHWTILSNDIASQQSEATSLLSPDKNEYVTSATSKLGIWKHVKDSYIALWNTLYSSRGFFTAQSQLYYGLIAGFIWSDFTRSFVSCTLGVHTVGLCMFIVNLTSSLTSLLVALLNEKVSVRLLASFKTFIDIPTCILAIAWTPSSDTMFIPYVLSVLFGICHGLSRTIAFTIPVTYFRDIDSGYILCSCWMSVGVVVSQLISFSLCTKSVIYVVLTVSLLSTCVLFLGDCIVKGAHRNNNGD